MIKLGFRRYASQVDHRSIEAPITRFPTTSGQWYEYCISSFHNVHYYLFLSCSKLTSPLPALVRGSQNHWSSVVAYSAYSGMRNNDCWCDHIGLIVYSAISLALLEFHLTLMWSGCKSPDPSSTCQYWKWFLFCSLSSVRYYIFLGLYYLWFSIIHGRGRWVKT